MLEVVAFAAAMTASTTGSALVIYYKAKSRFGVGGRGQSASLTSPAPSSVLELDDEPPPPPLSSALTAATRRRPSPAVAPLVR